MDSNQIHLTVEWKVYIEGQLRDAIKLFWEIREKNIKNVQHIVHEINLNVFKEHFLDLIYYLITKYKSSLVNVEMKMLWENEYRIIERDMNLKHKYDLCLCVLEMILIECPSNCFAECMGRIANVIR